MQARKEFLGRRAVERLEVDGQRLVVWDTKIDGFGLRIGSGGAKTFVFVYRFPRGRGGKMRWYTIGKVGDFTPEKARSEAEILRGDYSRGLDPAARRTAERDAHAARLTAQTVTVRQVAEDFVTRYAMKQNRSWRETQRILNRHLVSGFGDRSIHTITRREINELLDEVEDTSGAPMATAALAQIRKLFNWYATRDGEFNTPIVRGMARTNPRKLARDRVLSDIEIRVLWRALDASPAPYRQLVRFLLLTAQRREEAARAQQSEFVGDSWTIPAARYKTGIPQVVPLTPEARRQIDELADVHALGPHVFSSSGRKPFSGFSKAKRQLDDRIEALLIEERGAPPEAGKRLMPPWRLHDLRRTAKTLMVRAGVRPDISERVLGHVIGGVEGTYDRHDYLTERRAALQTLAQEIERLIQSPVEPSRPAGRTPAADALAPAITG
jgi:integrase